MARFKVQVSEKSAAQRCAYCHDNLGGHRWSCVECGTALHTDCAKEGCPTVGCAKRGQRPPHLQPTREELAELTRFISGTPPHRVVHSWPDTVPVQTTPQAPAQNRRPDWNRVIRFVLVLAFLPITIPLLPITLLALVLFLWMGGF